MGGIMIRLQLCWPWQRHLGMGQKKRSGNVKAKACAQVPDEDSFEHRCGKLARLRSKYAAIGKEEWWWIMDETTDEVARQLNTHAYAVLDGFFVPALADEIRAAVAAAYSEGQLNEVKIVNGKSGEATVNANLRGDLVKWADSNDRGFACLKHYTVLLGTFVSELSDRLPQLKCINSHSKCMATCYPPGTRYTAHVDHDGKNESTKTRRLTCITYLNTGWKNGDGGELAIYAPASLEDQSSLSQQPLARVAPLHNRLVVFFPDWRVPHEVLAATVPRFALTTWFTENEKAGPKKMVSANVLAEPSPNPSADCAGQSAESDGDVSTSGQQSGYPTRCDPAAESLESAASCGAAEAAQSMPTCEDGASWIVGETGEDVSVQFLVPWATCLQDLDVDIADHAIRVVRSSSGDCQLDETREPMLVELPSEFVGRADMSSAAAAFSKRKQRLTVKFPLR